VYKNACGYVHLSEKHFADTFRSNGDKGDMKFSGIIGIEDSNISEEDRIDASKAMIESTKIVIWTINEWMSNKRDLNNNK
ncbi:MAG: hypothetical protein CVU05_14235, partial [Bacteroidetes bacterium HGW-Bacteroidetes-21]